MDGIYSSLGELVDVMRARSVRIRPELRALLDELIEDRANSADIPWHATMIIDRIASQLAGPSTDAHVGSHQAVTAWLDNDNVSFTEGTDGDEDLLNLHPSELQEQALGLLGFQVEWV